MDNFSTLLDNVKNHLKAKGWTKSGQTFYLPNGDNWGIINFQKSKSSSKSEVIFTVNIGTSSATVRPYRNQNLKKKPEVEEGEFNERIGFYLNERKDHWWTLREGDNVNALSDEIIRILDEIAVPEIEKYITDEGLLEQLMSGRCPGLTGFQRLIYLAILLKKLDPERLVSYLPELFERASAARKENDVREYLKDYHII